MAKKISKHSRAARRGEVEVGGEAKALENLPKDDNNDLKKHIIRTTIKAENLLAKKMEMDKVRKKGNKKVTSTLKHKTERTSKLAGVLASKIQQSIEKARYVQTARKSGWDQINKSIVIRNELADAQEAELAESLKEKEEAEAKKREEDEYVKLFFGDGKQAEPVQEEEDKSVKPKASGNIYDMLEEADC